MENLRGVSAFLGASIDALPIECRIPFVAPVFPPRRAFFPMENMKMRDNDSVRVRSTRDSWLRRVPLHDNLAARPEAQAEESPWSIEQLPERLREVAVLIAGGATQVEAASQLGVHKNTIANRLREIGQLLSPFIVKGARPGDADRLLSRWERDVQPSTPSAPYRACQTSSSVVADHAPCQTEYQPVDQQAEYTSWWLHHADDTPAHRDVLDGGWRAAEDARWKTRLAELASRPAPAFVRMMQAD